MNFRSTPLVVRAVGVLSTDRGMDVSTVPPDAVQGQFPAYNVLSDNVHNWMASDMDNTDSGSFSLHTPARPALTSLPSQGLYPEDRVNLHAVSGVTGGVTFTTNCASMACQDQSPVMLPGIQGQRAVPLPGSGMVTDQHQLPKPSRGCLHCLSGESGHFHHLQGRLQTLDHH